MLYQNRFGWFIVVLIVAGLLHMLEPQATDTSTSQQSTRRVQILALDSAQLLLVAQLPQGWQMQEMDLESDSGLIALFADEPWSFCIYTIPAGDWDVSQAVAQHTTMLEVDSENTLIEQQPEDITIGSHTGKLFSYQGVGMEHRIDALETTSREVALLHTVATLIIDGQIYRLQSTVVKPEFCDEYEQEALLRKLRQLFQRFEIGTIEELEAMLRKLLPEVEPVEDPFDGPPLAVHNRLLQISLSPSSTQNNTRLGTLWSSVALTRVKSIKKSEIILRWKQLHTDTNTPWRYSSEVRTSIAWI